MSETINVPANPEYYRFFALLWLARNIHDGFSREYCNTSHPIVATVQELVCEAVRCEFERDRNDQWGDAWEHDDRVPFVPNSEATGMIVEKVIFDVLHSDALGREIYSTMLMYGWFIAA